jgi:hypothetical protein
MDVSALIPRQILEQFRDARVLRKTALRGFEAVCEAIFPENDLGAPSWRDIDIVNRADRYWDTLPPGSRALLETLFAALELGGAALAPAIGPLSKLPVDKRMQMLAGWKNSRVWPLRFVGEAIKSATTMLYVSHPLVSRYIGESKACGNEAVHGVPVKASAFKDLILKPKAEAP